MDMLLVVSMTDNIKSNIEDSIARISEIDNLILKLKKERILIASDLSHSCDLLNSIVKDKEFKEKIVDSVILKHKELATNGKTIAEAILQKAETV